MLLKPAPLTTTNEAQFEAWARLPEEVRKQLRKKRLWHRAATSVSPSVAAKNPRLTGLARRLTKSAQARALERGVAFEIHAKWVLDKLLIGKCEATGILFEFFPAAGSRDNFVPSIDRILPSLGYTMANARLVIWGYNAAKSSGTDADVMRMAEALVRNARGQTT